MSQIQYKQVEIKRKLRELKRLESNMHSINSKQVYDYKISSSSNKINDLIWNKYFDLKEENNNKVKYSFQQLMIMSKDEFKAAVNDYISHLYYWYYKENGFTDPSCMDQEFLTQLGLPVYADHDEIRKRFRELAKLYHPDNGGDADKFINIMEKYNNLKI